MCPCTQVDLSALLSPALFPEPRFYPASLIGVATSESAVSSVTGNNHTFCHTCTVNGCWHSEWKRHMIPVRTAQCRAFGCLIMMMVMVGVVDDWVIENYDSVSPSTTHRRIVL